MEQVTKRHVSQQTYTARKKKQMLITNYELKRGGMRQVGTVYLVDSSRRRRTVERTVLLLGVLRV
jgi:hypothetical protein